MAEPEEKQSEASPALDEAKLAEMIRQSTSSAVASSLKELREQQEARAPQPPAPQPTAQPEPDFWDEIINPKVNGRLQQAHLAAEAAEDMSEFYASDLWTEELEEWLTAEDPQERKREKAEFKAELEKRFKGLVQQGKGFKREVLAQQLLGEKISKDRTRYQESIGKRRKAQEENELVKARRAVDITTGNVSNFTAADIHKMPLDKMIEEFGGLQF